MTGTESASNATPRASNQGSPSDERIDTPGRPVTRQTTRAQRKKARPQRGGKAPKRTPKPKGKGTPPVSVMIPGTSTPFTPPERKPSPVPTTTPIRDSPSTTPIRDSSYTTPTSVSPEEERRTDIPDPDEPLIAPFPERPELIAPWFELHFNGAGYNLPTLENFTVVDQILRIRDFQDVERYAGLSPPDFGDEFGRTFRKQWEEELARFHLILKYLVAVPTDSTLGTRTLGSFLTYRDRN